MNFPNGRIIRRALGESDPHSPLLSERDTKQERRKERDNKKKRERERLSKGEGVSATDKKRWSERWGESR